MGDAYCSFAKLESSDWLFCLESTCLLFSRRHVRNLQSSKQATHPVLTASSLDSIVLSSFIAHHSLNRWRVATRPQQAPVAPQAPPRQQKEVPQRP